MPAFNRPSATVPDLLESDDPHPPSVRAQRAVVRSLVDALEQLISAGHDADGIRRQLDEELDRLGSQLQEAAAR